MARQTISRFLLVGALGLLSFIFGVILLRVLLSIAMALFLPETGGFVFSVSRRAFIIALLLFWTGIAAALLLLVRTLRRRHLP
jgi:hypothetical protein